MNRGTLLRFFDPDEVEEVDKRLQIGMKIRTVPSDKDSALIYHTIRRLTGNEDLDIILKWKHDINKALVGLNATTGVTQRPVVEGVLEGQPLAAFRTAVKVNNEIDFEIAKLNAGRAARAAHKLANAKATVAECEAVAQTAMLAYTTKSPISDGNVAAGINGVIHYFSPNKVLARQKRWMRRDLHKPADMKVRDFSNRLLKMNEELTHLPPFEHATKPQDLREDELIEIFVHGCPKRWLRKMDELDFDYLSKTLGDVITFLERMETSEDFDTVRNDQKSTSNGKGKKPAAKKGKPNSNGNGNGAFFCLQHGKNHTHNTNDCKVLASMIKGNDNKSNNKTWKRDASEAKDKSKEVQAFVKKQHKKAKKELHAFIEKTNAKNKKRKAPPPEEDESSVSSGEVKSVNQMDFSELNFDDLTEDVKSVTLDDDHSFATANEETS